ncbi:hypothetical protein XPA_007976 [Xanthoria parietina]
MQILSIFFLSLPLVTFAIPTPQLDEDDVNSTAITNSTDFFDPYYDAPISQESAEAQIKDAYEYWEDQVDAYATYTPKPPTPEESAAYQEELQYWSTASWEDVPFPTGTGDLYDIGLYASGTDAYALPKVTDPCGPDVQDGTQYDTCTRDPDGTINDAGSSFVDYSTEPKFYSVTCMEFPGANATGSFADAPTRTTQPLNATACKYKEFCASLENRSAPTDQWIWNSYEPGCALGMWLSSDPKAADWPDASRCEYGIFRLMSLYCFNGTNDDVATVNVAQLQGGGSTGMQVNAGYPSYIVAPEVLSVLTS